MSEVGRPLLVFDGDCAFCTRSARAGERWLGLAHVEPYQRLDLDALGLTAGQCDAALQWVAADGSVASAEAAVVAAFRSAGFGWRLVGHALALPGVRSLAGAVYRWVARNRHRMPGGSDACRL